MSLGYWWGRLGVWWHAVHKDNKESLDGSFHVQSDTRSTRTKLLLHNANLLTHNWPDRYRSGFWCRAMQTSCQQAAVTSWWGHCEMRVKLDTSQIMQYYDIIKLLTLFILENFVRQQNVISNFNFNCISWRKLKTRFSYVPKTTGVTNAKKLNNLSQTYYT
jgi:hypothetical protein